MKQKHKTKQCKGCSYGRTPDDMDRCNYCGELFSITDSATIDVNSEGYTGIKMSDIDILKFPKGMLQNNDTTLFLQTLKVEANEATCKIYKMNGNLQSFYVILSGNIYLTIHRFLKKATHLRLFNVYTDMQGMKDESLDMKEDILPTGVFCISFSKDIDIDNGEDEEDEVK